MRRPTGYRPFGVWKVIYRPEGGKGGVLLHYLLNMPNGNHQVFFIPAADTLLHYWFIMFVQYVLPLATQPSSFHLLLYSSN